MTIPTGKRLGPYEILLAIGAGGMGEVYKARDTRLGRDVAVKVLPASFANDRERMRRFELEARTVAALSHPNILAVYDVGLDDEAPYLVSELLDGGTLRDRLNEGQVPVRKAVDYALQITQGLAAAHEMGIVHRDLKPENVFVMRDGRVKILDFGLAKLAADATSSDQELTRTSSDIGTTPGVVLGTVGYMSPEQVRGEAADHRSDIFAFGAILYEMLSGRRAFKRDTAAETLTAILRTEPPEIDDPALHVPPALNRIVHRCLEKTPEQRFQSAKDLGFALDNISGPTGQTVPVRGAGAIPRWLWGVGALAAMCLVAATLVVMGLLEKPPAAPEIVRFQVRLPDKVTFTSGASFALSPDGRHIAFSAFSPDNNAGVWIQDLDATEARLIPDTATGPQPPPFFWSPDSRFVVFSHASTKLRRADVQSGAVQDICEKPGPPIGGSWNNNGVVIFGSTFSGLWKVPAAGGTPVPLTVLDASRQERQHELPSFLPDGRHFLYLRVSKVPDDTGIYVGSLDAPPDHQNEKRLLATGYGVGYVPSSDRKAGHLLFLRDRTLMAQTFDPYKLEFVGDPSPVVDQVGSVFETGNFSASGTALVYRSPTARNTQLMWLDRRGKSVGTVGDPGLINSPRVSPDGNRVAYQKSSEVPGDSDLWLLDLARGTSLRFTFGPRAADFPVWSPDGKEIVFASNRDGVYNLYRKPADSSKDEELLLKSNENKRPYAWSPDGRFLVYGVFSGNLVTEHLWVLPMQGEHTPFALSRTRFDESAAQFSPDGRWLAYESNESGRYDVYAREFKGSANASELSKKWVISNEGGHLPRWRADGKELVYSSLRANMMSVDLDTSRSFRASAPRDLFVIPVGAGTGSASADLKRFLFPVSVEGKGSQSFTVMLNWTSALKSW